MDSAFPACPKEQLKEIGAEARRCLAWILEGMTVAAEIEAFAREDQVILNVLCGDESSIVIGRRGQTLEALQLLVTRIVSRKYQEVLTGCRIIIDVEGYRERRRANLQDMARRTAEEVRETGEPVLLAPLNSYERYLVHSALKEEPGVASSSQGEGPMKQILVTLGPGQEA